MAFRIGTSIFFLTFGIVCMAQNLSIPSSWREFSNRHDLSTRITKSKNGITRIINQLNSSTGQFNGIGYWQSANAWSAIANHDHWAETDIYQAIIVNNLDLVFGLYSNYDQYQYNDDALWWATAALYSHRAYKNSVLLADAVATWTHVTNFVITEDQASSKMQPNKNFSIAETCNGATMAGGVFWRPTPDDQNVNSITTGLYLTLSAFLSELTGNSTYTEAAITSAKWIKVHNINSDGIVLDTVNAHDCSTSPSTWLFTYNSGKYIEGLSVLADVTQDSQWSDLALNIASAAVKSSAWEGSDGIITEGSNTAENNDAVGFKAVFLRGLHEAYTRSLNNDLKILLHSYLNVQYNALLELAANGDSYSANWHGPPQAFTAWGQLAALDVLTTAIDYN